MKPLSLFRAAERTVQTAAADRAEIAQQAADLISAAEAEAEAAHGAALASLNDTGGEVHNRG